MTRWNTGKSLPRLAVYFSRTTSKQAQASKQAAERERASERASERAEEQKSRRAEARRAPVVLLARIYSGETSSKDRPGRAAGKVLDSLDLGRADREEMERGSRP